MGTLIRAYNVEPLMSLLTPLPLWRWILPVTSLECLMSVQCASCKTTLGEEYAAVPRVLCPVCRDTGRIFNESVSSGMTLRSSVIASQRFGHTGREVLGAYAEKRAIDWASLSNHYEILSHNVADDFRALLGAAPTLSGDAIFLFRGRGIRDNQPIPPTAEQLGPLPLHLTPGEGRYHRHGERVLYLADSEDGVRREMEAWFTKGVPFVIRVEVPLAPLRIVDLSDLPSDHLITAVFSRAEMCKVKGRGPDNYIFSQCVGQLVSEHFDGMRIPGVRGEPGAHYKNVVLFRQLTDWLKWVYEPAYRMSPAPQEHVAVAAYYLWEKDGRVHGRDEAHWFQARRDLGDRY